MQSKDYGKCIDKYRSISDLENNELWKSKLVKQYKSQKLIGEEGNKRWN